MNHNPLTEKLKQIVFGHIRTITLKGGVSLYYNIMDDIERCTIIDEEDLEQRLKSEGIIKK